VRNFILNTLRLLLTKGLVDNHYGGMNINPHNRPHDYFFRRTFDSAEHARDLLRTFLPAELLEDLQLDTLRREKESFLSPADAESMLDLLYSAQCADGSKVVVYFLMEHKSWVDREIARKLLLYVLRVQEWIARNGQAPQLVIPVVIYQGEAVWDEPLSLRDKVNTKQQYRQFIPDMNVIFIDLPRFPADQFRGSEDFLARMWTMQWIRRRERDFETLQQIFSFVQRMQEIAFQTELIDDIILYVYSTTDAANFESLHKAILAGIQTKQDDVMRTCLDVLLEQRFEKLYGELISSSKEQAWEAGRKEGEEAGILIGQIRAFQQVFDLSVTSEAELKTLSIEQLQTRLQQVQAIARRAPNS
jgi:predicted transposase/invertase (TIGR01784 family)